MNSGSIVNYLVNGMQQCATLIFESLIDNSESNTVVTVKPDGDSTKKIDLIAENFMLSLFEKMSLKINVLTEESGLINLCPNPDYLAFLDPIDGTEMFLRKIPLSNISVSVFDLQKSKPFVSVVYDISMKKFYIAEHNKAYCVDNGIIRTLQTSDIKKVSNAFISSYLLTSERLNLFSQNKKLLEKVGKFFTYGGPLEIARVAEGTVDAFVEFAKGFKPIDYVSGIHICECTGAIASDLNGNEIKFTTELYKRQKFIVAANQYLHNDLLKIIHD